MEHNAPMSTAGQSILAGLQDALVSEEFYNLVE